MIKEGDIDAALSEAQQAVEQLAAATGAATVSTIEAAAEAPVASAGAAAPGAGLPAIDLSALPPAFERLFKLRVAVRVRLAERRMPVGEILQLSNGAILEFNTPVQSELKLLVNNKCVGTGEAVKVGENFGLRVRHVGDVSPGEAMLGAASQG